MFRKMLGYESCLEVGCDMLDGAMPFRTLHWILRTAEYPITHLELGREQLGVAPSVFVRPMSGRLEKNIQNLRTLRLTLRPGGESEALLMLRCKEERMKAFKKFVRFVLEVPNLETFASSCTKNDSSVSASRWSFGTVFAAVTAEFKPPVRTLTKLRVPELERLGICFEHLLRVVEVTCSTLTRLKLRALEDWRSTPVDVEERIRQAHGGKEFELDVALSFVNGV